MTAGGRPAQADAGTAAADAGAAARRFLLRTLTLYWATDTIATSLLPYWAYRRTASAELPADEPAPVPTAIDLPRGEVVRFPEPRRELAGRYFTIAAWGEHDRGGRFPTAAEPRLLAARLRPTIRPSRQP